MERALRGSLHVIGSELLAIVEANALTEKKAKRLAVILDDPALGDVGDDLRMRVVVDETREDGLYDLRREPVAQVRGVDRADVTEGGDFEHSTATLLRGVGMIALNRRGELALAAAEHQQRDRASLCADRAHRAGPPREG